jgi:hypothetical protein
MPEGAGTGTEHHCCKSIKKFSLSLLPNQPDRKGRDFCSHMLGDPDGEGRVFVGFGLDEHAT